MEIPHWSAPLHKRYGAVFQISRRATIVWLSTESQQFTDANVWWRHQMETFSVLLAICAGNSPIPGEFPTQRPVTRNFDVFFDLRPNKRLSKQWWGWWFETPSCPLWRHCNGMMVSHIRIVAVNDNNQPRSFTHTHRHIHPFTRFVSQDWFTSLLVRTHECPE